MYRTTSVARLAGASVLLVILPAWGLLYRSVVGEPTVNTWALALTIMLPVSALLIGATLDRSPAPSGREYAIGFLFGVVVLSVAYVGAVATDYAVVSAALRLTPLDLVRIAAFAAGLGGALTIVDLRYLGRPLTAAALEERYLDKPR